ENTPESETRRSDSSRPAALRYVIVYNPASTTTSHREEHFAVLGKRPSIILHNNFQRVHGVTQRLHRVRDRAGVRGGLGRRIRMQMLGLLTHLRERGSVFLH